MGYNFSTTANLVCQLTDVGKRKLAKNNGSFRITHFKLGDDEINYNLYNPGNIDSEDADIVNTPILEPVSDAKYALRFPLVTMPEGTKRVADLVISPNNIVFAFTPAGSDSVTINVQTVYNSDSSYIVGINNINSELVESANIIMDPQAQSRLTNTNSSTNDVYVGAVKNSIQNSEASFRLLVQFKKELSKTVDYTKSVQICTLQITGAESNAFTMIDIFAHKDAKINITVGAPLQPRSGGSPNEINLGGGVTVDPINLINNQENQNLNQA